MIQMRLQRPGDTGPVDVELEPVESGPDTGFTGRFGNVVAHLHVEWVGRDRGLMRVRGAVHPFFVSVSAPRAEVWLSGRRYVFHVCDRTPRRAGATQRIAREHDLRAPMPGTILKVQVGVGQTVQARQPLIVLESMKMEMSLSLPDGGVVREVLCRPGQIVEADSVLLRVDPAEDQGGPREG